MTEEEEHVVANGTPRIIGKSSQAPTRTFQVIDGATNTVIRETRRPDSCDPALEQPQRPKLEALMALTPDKPLIQ